MKIKTVNIDADVEAVIRDSLMVGDNLTMQGQLGPALYKKTMNVLDKLGFKWNKKLKCHVGEKGSGYALQEALSEGKVVDEKKTYQFFETPDTLADRMVQVAYLKPGHRVLEPSAGFGRIIQAIWRQPKSEVPPVLFAMDINPKCVQRLKEFDAERSQSSTWGRTLCVSEGDFLQHEEKYDRILMNPPFTGLADCQHVKHAYDLLLPGGRLVAITAQSWKYNSTRKAMEFKEWLVDLVDTGWAEIEEVPAGTFKESGTDIASIMLMIQKPSA